MALLCTGFLAFGNVAPVHAQAVCNRTSVGFTPITDLGEDLYNGEQGGLYPGGSNVIPASHEELGKRLAAMIVPLNQNGLPDNGAGKIVMVSIGVSNTRNEFGGYATDDTTTVSFPAAFKPQADADPAKNPKLVMVNGAEGGNAIDEWLAEAPATWAKVINTKLPQAGVTAQQVQAAWIKLPDRGQTQPFPIDQVSYRDKLKQLLQKAKQKFPNLVIAYLSSRSYGGYSDKTTSNIEPYAYQSAFGVKWVIADQMLGDASISPDPDQNPLTNDGKAPWVAWGPYFWADGTTPRQDGLTWLCSDFQSDGLHQNNAGVKKVADRLLAQMKTDPTACGWFLKDGCGSTTPPPPGKIGDLNGDGQVDVIDLGILLAQWTGNGVGDLNQDGRVDVIDLGILLASWT